MNLSPIALGAPQGDGTWVRWTALTEQRPHARPVHVRSVRSMESCLEALGEELPPLDTDLRFTTKIAKGSADRYLSIDREGDRARISLHLTGSSVPSVSSSIGIDGVMYDTASGSFLDGWIRPSAWSRAATIGLGALYLGMAVVIVRSIADAATQAHWADVLVGGTFAAVLAGICVVMLRKQRKLTVYLAGELVATVEQGTGAEVRTPSEGSVIPRPPERVMTTTEREVRQAMTGVSRSRPEPVTAIGCLRFAAVAVVGILLVVGSIIIVS